MHMPVRNQHDSPLPPQHALRRTRLGGLWTSIALFAIILVLLLVFILQNGHRVDISFFGAHGHLPLGVALLLAAVLGILLVMIPGTGRIIQLRVIAHRHRQVDAAPASSTSDSPERRGTPAEQEEA